jgi:hypothetical protein
MAFTKGAVADRGEATIHHNIDRDDAQICIPNSGRAGAYIGTGVCLGPDQVEYLVVLFESSTGGGYASSITIACEL